MPWNDVMKSIYFNISVCLSANCSCSNKAPVKWFRNPQFRCSRWVYALRPQRWLLTKYRCCWNSDPPSIFAPWCSWNWCTWCQRWRGRSDSDSWELQKSSSPCLDFSIETGMKIEPNSAVVDWQAPLLRLHKWLLGQGCFCCCGSYRRAEAELTVEVAAAKKERPLDKYTPAKIQAKKVTVNCFLGVCCGSTDACSCLAGSSFFSSSLLLFSMTTNVSS